MAGLLKGKKSSQFISLSFLPTEKENPEVRISPYREGKYWVFSLVDNGIGISKEDLAYIFTIFNRMKNQDMRVQALAWPMWKR